MRLDPSFALAWARLARACLCLLRTKRRKLCRLSGPTPKKQVDQARKLQPALAETVLAGYVHYYCELNYDAAIQSFEKAGQLSQTMPKSCARWRSLIGANCNGSEALNTSLARSSSTRAMSSCSEIRKTRSSSCIDCPLRFAVVDKILEIVPEDVQMLATKAEVLHQMGDLTRARALLEPLHPDTSTYLFYKQAEQLAFERKYADAIRTFSQHISTDISGAPAHYRAQIQSRIAQLTDWNGDHAAAQ